MLTFEIPEVTDELPPIECDEFISNDNLNEQQSSHPLYRNDEFISNGDQAVVNSLESYNKGMMLHGSSSESSSGFNTRNMGKPFDGNDAILTLNTSASSKISFSSQLKVKFPL